MKTQYGEGLDILFQSKSEEFVTTETYRDLE
jgi:hypothetical protein